MKIEIPKLAKKELNKFAMICNGRSPLPILANILIEAVDNKITLLATNLEVAVKQDFDATVIEPGKTTVLGKKLVDIIDRFGDEPILINTTDHNIEFEQGNTKFKLPTISPDDFPELGGYPVQEIEIEMSSLLQALKRVSYTASSDNSRYNLNNVLIENDVMVATDGHRLSKCTIPFKVEGRVLLPLVACQAIMKSFFDAGTCIFGYSEKWVTVSNGIITTYCRLPDGDYPDYTKVIPKESGIKAVVSKAEFLNSIKRVSSVLTPNDIGLNISVNNETVAITKQTEIGAASDSFSTLGLGEFSFIANSKYLNDCITNIESDNIVLEFVKEGAPVLFTPQNDNTHLSLVMPMRK